MEDFRDHFITDDTLFGVRGKWSACGWSVSDGSSSYLHRPIEKSVGE